MKDFGFDFLNLMFVFCFLALISCLFIYDLTFFFFSFQFLLLFSAMGSRIGFEIYKQTKYCIVLYYIVFVYFVLSCLVLSCWEINRPHKKMQEKEKWYLCIIEHFFICQKFLGFELNECSITSHPFQEFNPPYLKNLKEPN